MTVDNFIDLVYNKLQLDSEQISSITDAILSIDSGLGITYLNELITTYGDDSTLGEVFTNDTDLIIDTINSLLRDITNIKEADITDITISDKDISNAKKKYCNW